MFRDSCTHLWRSPKLARTAYEGVYIIISIFVLLSVLFLFSLRHHTLTSHRIPQTFFQIAQPPASNRGLAAGVIGRPHLLNSGLLLILSTGFPLFASHYISNRFLEITIASASVIKSPAQARSRASRKAGSTFAAPTAYFAWLVIKEGASAEFPPEG